MIRAAARIAPRLERAESAQAADRLLRSVSGIGPWTSAEVRRVALGDPDAISIGDYHIPDLVAWALVGEPRADDARMIELLEPYRGAARAGPASAGGIGSPAPTLRAADRPSVDRRPLGGGPRQGYRQRKAGA